MPVVVKTSIHSGASTVTLYFPLIVAVKRANPAEGVGARSLFWHPHELNRALRMQLQDIQMIKLQDRHIADGASCGRVQGSTVEGR